MNDATPHRDLYADAEGHWAILTHGGDLAPPSSIELASPTPHIPLPGITHRLLPIGTQSDLGVEWLTDPEITAEAKTDHVRRVFATVREAAISGLVEYLRPKVAEFQARRIVSVGGWLVSLDEVALRRRFPRVDSSQVRAALVLIRDET